MTGQLLELAALGVDDLILVLAVPSRTRWRRSPTASRRTS